MSRRRSGITIIELLVVLAVLAVLTAVTVPVVSRAMRSSRDGASLLQLKTHATVLSQYAMDHRGLAPFIADPDATYSVVRGGGITMEFEFFDSSEAWVVALVDEYYGIGLQGGWEVFAYPGPNAGLYQYSPSYIASPRFWNERTRARGQLGPNRVAGVRYPSAKACFLELEMRRGFPLWGAGGLIGREEWAFGFTDGSARRPPPSDLIRPYPRGEGDGGRFSVGVVGMHTLDGILGRDVK